jgi:preprotein translocase subunit SecF
MAFMLKPIELVPQDTKIPFASFFRPCFMVSGALMLISAILIATVGFNFGIDFRGGTVMELRNKQGPADLGALRTTLGGLGLGDVQIQEFGAPDLVLIKVAQQPGGEQAQQEAVKTIQAALGDSVEIRRTEVVGATVSGELVEKALIALVLTCLGIFVYVWFRFEWQFALGAVVALFHDVFITAGIFSALQLDFDLTIVAALLTILGYSINDTVVIFDRIRENLRKYKKRPLPDVIDLSINETLSRTAMTTGTTFLALLGLYIFGGEVIRGFTFAILFGVLIGTYSSVFIASPFLLMFGVKRDWSGVDAPKPGRQRVDA